MVLPTPPTPMLTYIDFLLVTGHYQPDYQGCHDSVAEVIDEEDEAQESSTHEKNDLGNTKLEPLTIKKCCKLIQSYT